MSDPSVQVDTVVHVRSPGARRRPDPAEQLFERTYAAAVGLARRVLDRDLSNAAAGPVAEQIAMDAVLRSTDRRTRDDRRGVARVMARVADSSLDRLVGHPGSVPLHPELLGPDIDFDGVLGLSELQEALCDLRRRERRVGVLALAAGLDPTQVAALLDLPLDETLRCLARVGTRLADGRRIGVDQVFEVHT